MSVEITENGDVIIRPEPSEPVYTVCKECGDKLYGGEVSGPDANGYCDSCNE